jgi:hypothetical protein
MGLFDKKYCDFCGEKIGLLGNRKLADGNMCKDCFKKASPYLTGRKEFAVAEMKQHLEEREANKAKVASINPTSTYGTGTKVYVDENQGLWFVSSDKNWRNDNPDILTIEQVTGVLVDVDEDKREQYRELQDGKQESYNPPRYEYSYTFSVTINVNTPWFSEIEFRVGDRIDSRTSPEFRFAEEQARKIEEALSSVHAGVREQAVAANAPKVAVTCPFCQATTTPDENGRCEFCGGAINS